MKSCKRIFVCLLLLGLLTAMAGMPAYAESPDLDRTGSITISMRSDGRAISGGSLVLYHVADIVAQGDGFAYVYTEDFSGCTASLENPGSEETIRAVEQYCHQHGLAGTELLIGSDGTVSAGNLRLGIYMLVQGKTAAGFEAITPFLVTIPCQQGQALVYDIDASPKLAARSEPTPTPAVTTPPNKEPIPQTGQLWWPVPVMAGFGLLLIVMGVYFRRSGRNEA